MIISLIAAASTNHVIGKDNKLLWHLPNDLKFFKNTTWAMPVIMGRKTFEALAGVPLPGRFNIVITRQAGWQAGNPDIEVAAGLEEAIALAKKTDCKEAFIIGGGEIYAAAISLADKIYLTRVHVTLDGDAFFPEIDSSRWDMISPIDFPADEKHQYGYSFQTFERKNIKPEHNDR